MTTIIDLLNERWKNSDKKVYLIRFIIAFVYCLLSFVMVTQGGFFVLTLLNEKVGNPMLHIGLLEVFPAALFISVQMLYLSYICFFVLKVIVVPWVYGTTKLIKDIESMVGPYPRWFWMFFIVSWKFICPLVLIVSPENKPS